MTIESTIEILKSHLLKEGLALCKNNDTQFPLDGLKESEALRNIVELIDDTSAVPEWAEESPTAPIPSDMLSALRGMVGSAH